MYTIPSWSIKAGISRLTRITVSGLIIAVLCSPAVYADCTATGDAAIISSHCGGDYILYRTDTGSTTLTLDNETSGSVELRTDNNGISDVDHTLILSGHTILNRPDYSAVIMETFSANRNASVIAGEDVEITSIGGFGGIWVRNDVSGNVSIDSAATVTATGAEAPALTATTNYGSASVNNSGTAVSNNNWGLYSEGGYNNSPDNQVQVSITNSGTVSSYLAGARAINYNGLAYIGNSGTINSLTRQGLVAWSADGDVTIENSGTVSSGDDNAIHAVSNTGDVTVINSGSLTSADDPGIVAVREGYSGILVRVDTSGSVSVTNTATGTISSADDYGIAAATPSGAVDIDNSGSIDALGGIKAVTDDGAVNFANSGTVDSSTRQGMMAQSGNGAVTVDNSGSITSGDDNAIQAVSTTGDITVTNSGSLTSVHNSGISDVRDGYSGILATVGTSGSVSVSNTATGTISSADDYGISVITPSGAVSINNSGSVSGLSGVKAVSSGAASFNNSGHVSAASSGVFINGSSNVITNTGTIETSGTTAIETGNGDTTITNSGTISAGSTSATAISMGNGNNRLILNTGSAIVGNVTNGSGTNTLELNGSGSLDANQISDAGQYQGFSNIEKTGDGSWQITGTSTEVGWTIYGGTLSVSGTVKNIDVQSGTLSGSGNIGSILVGSGGTLSPGNSIGTTNADDVTFSSGSAFEVEVTPEGTNDKIIASGTVTINSGATISIVPLNGTDDGSTFDPYTRYTIITASSGITGQFDTVDDSFAFLDVQLDYDGNNLYMGLLRNNMDFTAVAQTGNQSGVAAVIEQEGINSALYRAILPLTETGARDAFGQLSGEVYPSTATMLLNDSRFIREAILSRNLKAASNDGKVMVWGDAFGSWSDMDKTGGTESFDRTIGGIMTGVEKRFGTSFSAGVAFGYAHSDFDVDSYSSSGTADSYYIGAYTSKKFGSLDLTAGAAYGWHQIDTDRNVSFGTFSDRMQADYDGNTTQFFGETSYSFTGDKVKASPFLNLAYVNLNTEGFTESGSDASLSTGSSSSDIVYSTLGVRTETKLMLGKTSIRPNVTIGWMHSFGDNTPEKDFSLDGSSKFTTEGTPSARNSAVMELGLTGDITESTAINLVYSGQFSDDARDQSVKANLNISF